VRGRPHQFQAAIFNRAVQDPYGKRCNAPRSLSWREAPLSTTQCAARMRLLDQQTVRRAARGLPALLVAVLRQLALTTQWFPCDGRQGRRLRNSRTGIALSISSDPARACRWIHLSSSHSPRRRPRPWRPPQGDSSNWAGRPRATRRLRCADGRRSSASDRWRPIVRIRDGRLRCCVGADAISSATRRQAQI
jgi:hypothetical protein